MVSNPRSEDAYIERWRVIIFTNCNVRAKVKWQRIGDKELTDDETIVSATRTNVVICSLTEIVFVVSPDIQKYRRFGALEGFASRITGRVQRLKLFVGFAGAWLMRKLRVSVVSRPQRLVRRIVAV